MSLPYPPLSSSYPDLILSAISWRVAYQKTSDLKTTTATPGSCLWPTTRACPTSFSLLLSFSDPPLFYIMLLSHNIFFPSSSLLCSTRPPRRARQSHADPPRIWVDHRRSFATPTMPRMTDPPASFALLLAGRMFPRDNGPLSVASRRVLRPKTIATRAGYSRTKANSTSQTPPLRRAITRARAWHLRNPGLLCESARCQHWYLNYC